jgi:protein KTI12
MALITITGFPCSGKSKRAEQLKSQLESRIADPNYDGPNLKVVVLSDDSLNLSRTVYNGAPSTIFFRVVHLLRSSNR